MIGIEREFRIFFQNELFLKDMELTRGSLSKRALQTRMTQAQAYYEHLHISPLMVTN